MLFVSEMDGAQQEQRNHPFDKHLYKFLNTTGGQYNRENSLVTIARYQSAVEVWHPWRRTLKTRLDAFDFEDEQ